MVCYKMDDGDYDDNAYDDGDDDDDNAYDIIDDNDDWRDSS